MFVWDSVARRSATSWKSTKVENAAEMLPPTVPRPWNHRAKPHCCSIPKPSRALPIWFEAR